MIRVVSISDTHSLHWEMSHSIPTANILIHAGDITNIGNLKDIEDFCIFCDTLPIKEKVVCGGNHDFCFENSDKKQAISMLKNHGIIYLENEEYISGDGLVIYGSGWTPKFFNWAMMYERNSKMAELLWNNIPTYTDILVTHGPPHGILDLTYYDQENAGCELLRNRINKLNIPVHLMGHIHETYGYIKKKKTVFINSSICDLKYRPINKPIVFDIDILTKKVKIIDET